MHTYFQPRISVEQEEADIKEMIDEEYVHYLIGEVNGVLDDKSKRTQSTEHAQIDEED